MKHFIALLFVCLAAFQLSAQVNPSSALFTVLKTQDSLLFHVGFNTCDIQQFENLLSDNFEFYHDKSGFMPSKAAFIFSIKEGICKNDFKPRRELVEESLKVYTLEDNGELYGAVQMGIHRFYERNEAQEEHLTSVAKFTHIWLKEHNQWKLSRVISYDHQSTDLLKSPQGNYKANTAR